ncbi:SiaB family protein kinase [Clostridium formicaceticum]|uniref:Uncharacterized protein n=1 Tax=Clostridium formicaceticum TaxID=1497 RepID=A0AAC9RNT0_9CLOT|nr:SiaB family protein kinase [Clostridium formicaceticum]AOY77933.1 hypothetical protein BJL90_19950 [Clostridium formicaceticum]ARE88555.1 hypothetical protein CLFO_29610 [Clostridium formicaceticum]
MESNNIYRLQKQLKESNIELIFSGTFSQGLIEELGDALRLRLLDQQVTKGKVSAAFFTFVELAQNIRNYLKSKETEEDYFMVSGSGVIAITKTQHGYCVNSGNIIFNSDIENLKEKLDKILSLDMESLKRHYKEVMRTEIDKETGGAGLGLVQIARKASRPIEYHFEKINETLSFYTLTVSV